ncbi:hypothetical protein SLEP1_g60511 [Rubroshorea leprosula]|uniref:Uncharacterized protein n=1 Tax=Rubroshorea leprosula TaxID=152421 RepID=A0AAV5MZ90_9ROSI|nr:hypothetical protein SLEP1_g60511 [Rubroshorea leprosula]
MICGETKIKEFCPISMQTLEAPELGSVAVQTHTSITAVCGGSRFCR